MSDDYYDRVSGDFDLPRLPDGTLMSQAQLADLPFGDFDRTLLGRLYPDHIGRSLHTCMNSCAAFGFDCCAGDAMALRLEMKTHMKGIRIFCDEST